MRSPFLALLLPAAAIVACSASGTSEAPAQPAADSQNTTPAPGAGDASTPVTEAGPKDSGPTKPKNDCKLDALTGVTDVAAEFVTYAAPSTVPTTMTGGTLKGKYKVDKAKVFLPSGTAGLADPRASTGSVNAWAVFDGTNYRIALKASFTISSVLGPQSQGTDTVSQGGFTVSSANLTLDHACDTAITDEAEYSFTDTGGGRATLLIKQPTTYGDTYLQLDAAKE